MFCVTVKEKERDTGGKQICWERGHFLPCPWFCSSLYNGSLWSHTKLHSRSIRWEENVRVSPLWVKLSELFVSERQTCSFLFLFFSLTISSINGGRQNRGNQFYSNLLVGNRGTDNNSLIRDSYTGLNIRIFSGFY